MVQNVETVQENPPNACCAALKDKNAKLLEKYKKVAELRNQFRECTITIQENYNVIEKENESLKKALEELNLQANMWKDEKELEAGRRIDLEDEVSALEDEVRSLKQNGHSTSAEADKQLQERLVVAEKEIKQLNVLLDQERGSAALEKKKADEALKKSEKKADLEKQKAIRERKKADMAVAKSEEQQKLAETNFKMAMFEKNRADDLNTKLEEARNRAEKIEKEMHKQKCSDSEKREDLQHKRMAMEQKARADHLLKSCKLKSEELQKELHELISCTIDNNVPLRNNDVPAETDTVEFLKTQLELERSLVMHAKNATTIEAVRNKMLHQELCNLKQESCQFQQRLDILDKSFVHGGEGIDQLEKIGNEVSIRNMLGSDGSHIQLTDSGMDPQMLQSSAINSPWASFSDRPLVGPQERGVMTSANLLNCDPSVGGQNDYPKDKNPEGISCRERSSPCKKRKTSSEGIVLIDCSQNSGLGNDCMPASSPGPDPMKLHGNFNDGLDNLTELNYDFTQDFDEVVSFDIAELLAMDSAADEDSYRGAVAMPLSPMPLDVEILDEENSEMLFCRSS